MRIKIELPELLLRRAELAAAERGISSPAFVMKAVEEKLAAGRRSKEKPWMAGFGKLAHLREETARINRIIEEEFEQIEP